jgi:flagellar motor protein MotB
MAPIFVSTVIPICRDGIFTGPRVRNAWIAVLAAMVTAGCRQGAGTGAPAYPWGTYPSANASPQQQMNTLADLWRRQNDQAQANLDAIQQRQMDQLAQLQRQTQEQARLAQQQQAHQFDSQSQLARTNQANLEQLEELRRRAMELDTNNRDLHSQLAQSQQKTRLLEDQLQLLNQRLGDTSQELSTVLSSKHEIEQQYGILEASTRRRGGATITANNSLRQNVTAVSIPGVQVRQDGDVVRMDLPSDTLFMTQSATLNPAALPLLEQVAQALAQNYPRQMIGVEAHTDSDPVSGTAWRTNHQLSAAQAMAVFDQLSRAQGLSARQLFVLGHGPNHPVASNATAAGKSSNRRVEIVIYPETVADR